MPSQQESARAEIVDTKTTTCSAAAKDDSQTAITTQASDANVKNIDTTEDSQNGAAASSGEAASQDWKIEHGRKCKVFNDWCFENGVRMPKLEYPAYFEGGLVGMRATDTIEHREAFLSIPYKMLITVDGG